MRSVAIMAVKDLVLVTRDLLGLFFIIGFPIFMGIFFGSMYSGVGEKEGTSKIDVAVADEDQSAESAMFIKALADSGAVHVEKAEREKSLDRVRRGDLVGMIAIPKGFGKTAGLPWLKAPAVELGVDPSRLAEAGMLEGLVMQAAGQLTIERFKPVMSELGELFGWIAAEPATNATTEAKGAAKENSSAGFQIVRIEKLDVTHRPAPGTREELISRIRTKWDISFPQAMIWGVLGCAAAFAVSIVRERKQGTLLRLNAAPISKSHIILGKGLACFIAVMLVIAIMVALGMWLGMRPRSIGLLALAAVCVAAAFVGVTILMSVIGRTEEAVGGAAWGLNTLMAMFGGGMIPLAFMPPFMATLSTASPVKWSVLALEGAIWRGFTLSEMALPCAVLLGVGAGCLALGSIRLSRMVD
jgi:ABC-2 type transport system permease protein